MKIDLHCHTLKCKSGDGEGRNVTPELFKEKIEAADIKIVAVTNHNHFDIDQYLSLKNSVKDECEVWPGIELDVNGKGSRPGHVLIICSPLKVDEFNEKVKKLIKNEIPDEFVTSVTEMCSTFNSLQVVYIPHFFKDHQLNDEDMELLESKTYSKKRILREPSDIKSLGVLNSNGLKSIIGSDVKNWKNYENCSFADLKYPIKGFDNFLKLLDKDTSFINDLINNDYYETITVYGKAANEKYPFKIKIYNDVNVIFGDKGSGKSEILNSLELYFKNEKGIDVVKYSGGDKSSWFKELLKENPQDFSHENFMVSDCSEEISSIYNFKDVPPKKIENYVCYFSNISTNKKRRKLKILKQRKVLTFNLNSYQKLFKDYCNIANFERQLHSFKVYQNNSEKYKLLDELLKNLKKDAFRLCIDEWIKQQADNLTDKTIEKLDAYSSESDGTPEMPKETGFYKYCINRIRFNEAIKKVSEVLQSNEKEISNEYIGKIGDKGSGYLKSKIGFVNKSNFLEILPRQVSGKKKNIKVFLDALDSFRKHKFLNDLVSLITETNNKFSENIKTINYFIYNKKEFDLNNKGYTPSKGEMAILSLQYELLNKTNKDVFLIDEPEVNLGSTYIENTIVPLIKDLGKAKKKVVIATHDANIATRTYPVTSILKKSSNNVYETYQGSMFTNELVNILNGEILRWNEESEKYLEGGEIAFNERGTLYGATNRSGY